jgi:hypothetical protein
VDNIKMDLGGIVWGGMDCIGLAQLRDKCSGLVNAVMNLRVAQNGGKPRRGCTTGCFCCCCCCCYVAFPDISLIVNAMPNN